MTLILTQLEDARQAIRFEIEAMHMDPNPEQLLMEMIHAVSSSDK